MSGNGSGRNVSIWKYSYGTKPHVVFAMERRDRARQVFVRFNNPAKAGIDKRDRKSLGLVVREAKTGRLDPKLVRAAELAVQQFQARLLVDQRAALGDKKHRPNAAHRPAPPASVPAGSLTLRAGFDLALDPERGKYGSIRTRRYDQMRKYRERLFGGPRSASPLLDRTIAWTAFVPAEARALWRRMADRHVSGKGDEFGVRAAESIVDAIYSIAAWLREEHLIPADAARASAQWRKALKEEWAQRTGKPRTRPHRPRHTADEYRRIFAAIGDPRVDPRIRLAVELAAECRTGQVLRCTRRMLLLPETTPNAHQFNAGSLGQIEIPGSGKKHGEVVVLTPEQRRAVDDSLRGYLANYECAWRAGEIEDYYLFPGSKMRCSMRAVAVGRGRCDLT